MHQTEADLSPDERRREIAEIMESHVALKKSLGEA